jgi:AhpC/TSA family
MRKRLSLAAIFWLGLLLCLDVSASNGRPQTALQPGAKIPAFQLRDQAGRIQTFESLKGPNGLLLILSRSADWCPLCKSQLDRFRVGAREV